MFRFLAFACSTLCAALSTLVPRVDAAGQRFALFESGPVRPVAMSPDRSMLFVTNTPDGVLEVLAIEDDDLQHEASIPVGLEPVAVAARTNREIWVVNHLSDSISIVDVGREPPAVVRTLLVGDEPRDIVFGGADRRRAFVSTAHRGQNSPIDPELETPGVGRADVWVFDALDPGPSPGGDPLSIVTLFGDTPRALAVSPDGSRVYAAVFHSGNRTTTVSAHAVCDGGESAPPCTVQARTMPGGLPAPNTNVEGIGQPETGLIVRFDSATQIWEDELGRSWNAAMDIRLPDEDVFVIDATGDPPGLLRSFRGAGTILYNMAVNPVTGHLYVSNTEARNEVRFEPNVRGHMHEARITLIDGENVEPRHLNPHIDYTQIPSPPEVRDRSLALPLAMAVSADGEELYLAAFGSGRVAVIPTAALEDGSYQPDPARQIEVSGGGPGGLILDEERGLLFVSTRFDNGVSVVDLESRQERTHVLLHNPEPAEIVHGRRFLYDARYTSSNGEATCASCHVFGDLDSLAWDLGDPNGVVLPNPNPRTEEIIPGPFDELYEDFHPMKGPMTTQTLRGLAGHGPMHWRGDRTGGLVAGGDPLDERAAFARFNPAFVSLLGRDAPLAAHEIDAMADFVLALTPPPNPIRNLDNSLTPEQEEARDAYFNVRVERDEFACADCHRLDRERGFLGTDGSSSFNGFSHQVMKIPHFRNAYQKVGMFGMFPVLPDFLSGASGDQIRGFGFIHDGSVGLVFRPNVVEFLMAFPSNLAPIVGQQVTVQRDITAQTQTRVDLLIERAAVNECDLVVHGVFGGQRRGWQRRADGRFVSDRAREPSWGANELLEMTAPITWTCMPPGSGARTALDRDQDGFRNRDEVDRGAATDDAASIPDMSGCTGDCNLDDAVTIEELVRGVGIAQGRATVASCAAFDIDRDGEVAITELVRAVGAALAGCRAPGSPP